MITVPVILAGGRGERFWPRSRKDLPKQFLSLAGNTNMLRQTVDRLQGADICTGGAIWVSTREEYKGKVVESLRGFDGVRIVSEPMARNTAPGIGLAAIHLQKVYGEAVMVVLPADHSVTNVPAFHSVLAQAVRTAAQGYLVTLGIVPDRAETSYGYIERGPFCVEEGVYRVKRFVEKPSLDIAKEYLKQRTYLWNSGMFIFKVSTISHEMQEHLPTLYTQLLEISTHIGEPTYELILREVFEQIESISIDYGVLEKSSKIAVIPADIGWDDVGDWLSFGRLHSSDTHGNVIRAVALAYKAHNNIVDSDGNRLIMLAGVKDLVVVDTADVLLICSKEAILDMRAVVSMVRETKGGGYL